MKLFKDLFVAKNNIFFKIKNGHSIGNQLDNILVKFTNRVYYVSYY